MNKETFDSTFKISCFKDNLFPNYDECIKKWKEKGYEIKDSDRELQIESDEDHYDLDITICKANLIYEVSNYYKNKPAYLTLEMHCLLTQTLTAMEVMKK